MLVRRKVSGRLGFKKRVRIEFAAQTSIHEQTHMGKPKVKIKVSIKALDGEDVHKAEEINVHSSVYDEMHVGKPKVKIKTKANECVQGDEISIDAHSCTSGKVHIGGKPKVKIKQVRGLWMGKPKVKMKEL